ncbi:MAG: undecaprenyl-diphosphate phosphatase [Desulfovibrionaceae bacterium]|nr:undecaprenyl-diphosphate phosphatase [Desulfovibrionaceae bacterium]
MDSWLTGLILGAVQGLTEFLPVSSTGHLIIAGTLLDFTGVKAGIFDVAIQLGSILAVVALYRERFLGLFFPEKRRCAAKSMSGMRGILMLMLTSFPPALLGLLLHAQIKSLFTPGSVALSLGTGALMMLFVEKYCRRRRYAGCGTVDALTPLQALGIGCFQCLALWPGFSRSGSTIMGGMLLGADRKTAAEYSFLAAVPIMFMATGYDILKNWEVFSAADLPLFAAGMIAAFLFAWAAIRTFIAFVGRMTLLPFAWYRLILAPWVWFCLSA